MPFLLEAPGYSPAKMFRVLKEVALSKGMVKEHENQARSNPLCLPSRVCLVVSLRAISSSAARDPCLIEVSAGGDVSAPEAAEAVAEALKTFEGAADFSQIGAKVVTKKAKKVLTEEQQVEKDFSGLQKRPGYRMYI